MNNDNQQNNNGNNIVTPTLVDINKVVVDNNDNMLNRERSNIVSATIQANDAIDDKMAKEVNNQIKIEKGFTKKKIITIVGSLILLLIGGIASFILIKNFMKDDVVVETTKKVISNQELFKNSLSDSSKVTKYSSSNYELLLIPGNKYIFFDKTTNAYSYGAFDINDTLELFSSNVNEIVSIDIKETGLSYNETLLTLTGEEYKYYIMDNQNILVINAPMGLEKALLIINDEMKLVNFTETGTDITLEDGTVCLKDGMSIVINGQSFKMGE